MPRDTIRQHARARRTGLAPLWWGLRHPLRLLRRYGFGWFQFALLVMPVLLTFWLVVDPVDFCFLLRP
ncbi:hypothetical protein ABZV31_30225 [Streptomyces sp. NPDC005202]|uniref:hypothetical protein n=1 Tax=Streptomyces sp. NPDC005202 TaxID=3157021 RepID=UPI0033AF3292